MSAVAYRPDGEHTECPTVASGLVSLWEMLNRVVGGFYHAMDHLRIFHETQGGLSKEDVKKLLMRVQAYCEDMELTESVKNVKDTLRRVDIPVYFHSIRQELGMLRRIIENEATDRHIFSLKRAKMEFFEAESDRWNAVEEKLPSIAGDSRSALMCYIFEENTASVFHMMRVAEHGLRVLAKERRVTIPKKPLEWANWQDIIAKIKKSSDAVAGWRAGPAKDEALEFYRGAQGQFEAFKDTYRNNVMHSRRNYDEYVAASVAIHVREFMTTLASRIDERSIKAIRWGRK